MYTGWIQAHRNYAILTTPDCELEAFLTKHLIPYAVARKPQFEEYATIEQVYGNKVTRRSGKTRACVVQWTSSQMVVCG